RAYHPRRRDRLQLPPAPERPSMSLSIIATLMIVAWALFIIFLERRFPYDKGYPLVRPGLWVDLVGYAIIQSWVLGWVIDKLVHGIDALTGASQFGLVSGWPKWVQVVFFVFAHDLYIYLMHRFMHSNRYFWRIHEAHHSVTYVDWVAGARSHILEILLNQTIEVGFMLLLGAPRDVIIIKMAISGMWGIWIHCNVDVKTGWLQKFINGPEMHRWHHSLIYQGIGTNFGTKFAFWDWLFGTAYLPREKPAGYGISNPFPSGYFAQNLYAFRRFEEAQA